MQKGFIRRRGTTQVIGRWQADLHSITVDTDDSALRKAANEVLGTPQSIPVHAPERLPGLSHAERVVETPARIKYLALFALELETRGFELEPDEDEG
ncbi:MAG TPA: hypothetical protein VLG48_03785 [Candidatus Methylomirabilis sp.]|nr:hypothetical protein [Candidatus Methylomirabilis sp.]